MTRRGARSIRQAGVTLVELMIAVLLFAILSAGALTALTGQQRTVQQQTHASDAMDSARATMNYLTRQLRSLGSGIPDAVVVVNDFTDLPAAVTVGSDTLPAVTNCGSNRVPVLEVFNSNSGPDTLRLMLPDGAAWGGLADDFDTNDDKIEMWTADGTLPSLAVNDWVLVSDFSTGAVLTKATSGPAVCGSNICLEVHKADPAPWPAPFPASYVAGQFVVKARWLSFGVSSSAFGTEPTLVVTDHRTNAFEPAASGIEDLQIEVWIDANDDGSTAEVGAAANDDEIVFNHVGDTIAGTTGVTDACDLSKLRAIRLSMVARGTTKDPGTVIKRPALGDHPAATSADGYYRLVLRSVIAMRK